MKIGIVGAGAMGCLYGAKLSELPGHEVTLIDVWKEHIEAIKTNGLMMEEGELTKVYHQIKATDRSDLVGSCDLVILFVKSTLTATAVKNNSAVFGPSTVVLTLQNGLGNIEQIQEQLGETNVIAGTTAHGATMLAPGKIRHAGQGKTIIGELTGHRTERLQEIASLLQEAGFETEQSDHVMGLIWDKLLVNVGINALTALTGLQNGQLLDHPELTELLEQAVLEGEVVAKAKGINLSYQNPVDHTKEVCKATALNRSSMLQDITNHKETEIRMMNGAIVELGKQLGIKTPVNQTLTNLVILKQKGN